MWVTLIENETTFSIEGKDLEKNTQTPQCLKHFQPWNLIKKDLNMFFKFTCGKLQKFFVYSTPLESWMEKF